MTRANLMIAWLAVTAVAQPARGGPPLITDDPGVPPAGTWEINFALTVEHSRAGTAWQAPWVDVNYSLTDHFKVLVDGALSVEDARGRGAEAGEGFVLLGAKWLLLQDETAGIDLAFTPQVSVNGPGHAARRGLVDRGNSVFLPVEVNRPIFGGAVDVFAELGYQVNQYRADEWSYGVAGAWHASKTLDLLAEVHVVSDASFRDSEPVVNTGLVWQVREGRSLLFSVGRSLRDRDESATVLMYVGVQFVF